jgi:hypothetical protein
MSLVVLDYCSKREDGCICFLRTQYQQMSVYVLEGHLMFFELDPAQCGIPKTMNIIQISLVKFFVGAVTGAGAHFFIDVLAGYEANTCREKRVPPSAQRNALQRTLPRMPSDAEVRHDKQANAAQARQVIDIFHEISTLLVGIPSPVLSYMV